MRKAVFAGSHNFEFFASCVFIALFFYHAKPLDNLDHRSSCDILYSLRRVMCCSDVAKLRARVPIARNIFVQLATKSWKTKL